jgi:hypothetical protein
LYIADKNHAGDFVGAGTLFVDEGKAEIEAVSDGRCSVKGVGLAKLPSTLLTYKNAPLIRWTELSRIEKR